MNILYVIHAASFYGDDVINYFLNREKAEKFLKEQEKTKEYEDEYWYVEEVRLDN